MQKKFILYSLISLLFFSCFNYTFLRFSENYDPFLTHELISKSRSCVPDSSSKGFKLCQPIVQKLSNLAGAVDITGIPNDTISEITELALLMRHPYWGDKDKPCECSYEPLIIICNMKLHSVWFFGARIFQVSDKSYLSAYPDDIYRQNHISINISRYGLFRELYNGTFHPDYAHYMRSPSFVVVVDDFTKFKCGEQRRKYRLFINAGSDHLSISGIQVLDSHNICCAGQEITRQDTLKKIK